MSKPAVPLKNLGDLFAKALYAFCYIGDERYAVMTISRKVLALAKMAARDIVSKREG